MIVLFGRILGGDGWLPDFEPDFYRNPSTIERKAKTTQLAKVTQKKHKTTKIPAIPSLAKN
jgi:hypothetical protein